MSIVYTADVFCDGDDCSQWTNGVTGVKPPEKWRARERAQHERWIHVGGKDYCPACAKVRGLLPVKDAAQ
ncbi:hypothetical protein LA345_39270 (plasmid) [Burkholderia vietnamiensis]|nr:hypothetical protein [Burkholderia vietnamiensis]